MQDYQVTQDGRRQTDLDMYKVLFYTGKQINTKYYLLRLFHNIIYGFWRNMLPWQ